MPRELPKPPSNSASGSAGGRSNGKATLARKQHSSKNRRYELLLLGLVFGAIAIFVLGYAAGFKDTTFHTSWYMPLHSPNGAAEPVGTVQGGPLDTAKNTPLALSVRGLPVLPPGARYALFLLRPGGALFRCGDFVVGKGMTEVRLNYPGLTREPLGWVVARETPSGGAGPTLLVARRGRFH